MAKLAQQTGHRDFLKGRGFSEESINNFLGNASEKQLTGLTQGKILTREADIGSANIDPGSILAGQLGSDISMSTDVFAQEQRNIQSNLENRRSNIGREFEAKTAAERDLGRKRLGGTQAQLGVSKGLGLSSAEIGLIRQEEKFTSDRIDKLDKAKATALATADTQALDRINQSLIAEQERADKLAEMRFSRITESLRLQQTERGLDIQERTSEANIENQRFNQTIAEAGITGLFDGAETQDAKQNRIANAFTQAGLTGQLDGKDTLAMQQFRDNIKQLDFENQKGLLSLQASLPSGFSTTIKLPDGTTVKLNGLKRVVGGGGGGMSASDILNFKVKAWELAEKMPADWAESFDLGGDTPFTVFGTGTDELTLLQEGSELRSVVDANMSQTLFGATPLLKKAEVQQLLDFARTNYNMNDKEAQAFIVGAVSDSNGKIENIDGNNVKAEKWSAKGFR